MHFKTRVSVASPVPVTITRADGIAYINTQKRGDKYRMNIPPGHYDIIGPHTIERARAYERRINLPIRQRLNFRTYALEYAPNPHIGTIDHRRGVITLDTKLKNEPDHVRKFVYLHELGHKKYQDEHLADLYAAKNLIAKGYDPALIMEGATYLRGRQNPLTIKLQKALRQ